MAHDEPLLRVVRGTPTAAELAALVGVLVTRSRPAPAPRPATRSAWARSGLPGATAGMPGRPAADGWRFSARPR
ncbi:acyl-CoA carboxylase subunit epsilon [Plantactinospora siamensis]|uniref:Acyl-CoA carboxylase subunit epsilon n=1 Tax=Plantactinospora siamensis TaxID=555372 RepID=A0ABV6NWV5_9ACTN